MSKSIRVRIAPSPTGYIHVGNAYSAYYNHIFAKKNKGKFVLRIDDTDRERHVSDSEQQIYELFEWLGIIWDEGPQKGGPHKNYRQSERLEIYRKEADHLVAEGKAYHKDGAIFLKVDNKGNVKFNDLVRGVVSVEKSEIKDQVLIKSEKFDHYPTYMFATVVDDADFDITHVIRGEDHLSNTSKQILMYEALNKPIPAFAHLPLLRNDNKSKLSKRQDHASLGWYKEQGFLPKAIRNYFSLLGWTHPKEKDIFTEDEFVKLFSFDKMNKTAPIFDLQKLTWMNGHYIREMKTEELASELLSYLQENDRSSYDQVESDGKYLNQVLSITQERLKTLGEFWEQNKYFFETPQPDKKTVLAFWDSQNELTTFLSAVLKLLLDSNLEWTAEKLHTELDNLREDSNIKPKVAFMSLRHIISGQSVTPPIFETLEVLGKEETTNRIKNFSSIV